MNNGKNGWVKLVISTLLGLVTIGMVTVLKVHDSRIECYAREALIRDERLQEKDTELLKALYAYVTAQNDTNKKIEVGLGEIKKDIDYMQKDIGYIKKKVQ